MREMKEVTVDVVLRPLGRSVEEDALVEINVRLDVEELVESESSSPLPTTPTTTVILSLLYSLPGAESNRKKMKINNVTLRVTPPLPSRTRRPNFTSSR